MISLIQKKIDKLSDVNSKKSSPSIIQNKPLPSPSVQEKSLFLKNLNESGAKSAILSLIPEYNDNYVPLSRQTNAKMDNLYCKAYESLPYNQIITLSRRALSNLSISVEDSEFIQKSTTKQHESKFWYQVRAGIITASKFKSVCHANILMPPKSLILQICYPEKHKFTTAATKYGIEHEKDALDILKIHINNTHIQPNIFNSGFFRIPEYPFLGASPDALMNCKCCKHGYVIEVKCPYKLISNTIDDLAKTDKNFCLEYNTENKRYNLKLDHPYYFQVQLQMLLTGRPKCYFIVYSKSLCIIEKISFSKNFVEENVQKAKKFYMLAILPELLSKWFSRENVMLPSTHKKNKCICMEEKDSPIVQCKNENCEIKTYHISCLGFDTVPQVTKWYCPYCRKNK